MLLIAVALVQSQVPPSPRPAPPPPSDVVVTAPTDPGPLPTVTVPATNAGLKNRVTFENSQRIAKCAMRLPVPRLKAAIDGAPNSAPQREAQAWLVRMTAACNADPGILSQFGRGSSNAVNASMGAGLGSLESNLVGFGVGGENEAVRSAGGASVYDYGALLETALKTYAPDLGLSTRETADAATRARFNAREVPRNDMRQLADYRYFETAVCMVRMQPDLATRMFRMRAGSSDENRVRARLISNARACVGNAKRVVVDATQFRVYVIDALYRWVLAARNVATLLPDERVSAR